MVPLVGRIARSKGWVAQPKEDRWHNKPTPLMGGIAIYLGFSIPLLLAADFSSIISLALNPSLDISSVSLPTVIWLGSSFLFFIGLFDDLRNIKPHSKLLCQILAASLVVFLGFRLNWFDSMTIDMIVTLFWIIGITNAYNLLDNMDGLCAGIGLISAIILAVLFLGDFYGAALIALALAGALAGFLIYNFNPASIFMGDCGSLVIGFSMAVLSLCFSKVSPVNPVAIAAVPILLQLVPIFDTTLVTAIRLLSGRKASIGGRDHTSHRLVLIGLSERRAVLFLYVITTIAGLAAVFVSRTDTLTSPAVIIPIAIAIVLMGIYLAQLRIYPEKEFSVLLERSYTPVLRELTYKRHILLVILDMCLIMFSYYLAYRLRFDTSEFPYYFPVFLSSLPAILVCKFIAFFIAGVYRSIWDFLSAQDILVYVKGSVLATLFSIVVVTFIYRFRDFSKGIFLIDWMLTTGLLIGTRGSFRLFLEFIKRKGANGDHVIIYGAGRGGEILLREILNNGHLHLKPVGFIDDNSLKVGKRIQGFPILGTFTELERVMKKQKVNGLVISFRTHDDGKLNDIKTFCQSRGLFLKKFAIKLNTVEI